MKSPVSHRVPLWPWVSLLLLLVLRLAWLNAYPLNSDESQHAHVAWAWTQGLLPYRDVFDNHGPLFGWLHAPLLALMDGRPDVLTWLRMAMQVWYLLALGAVGWIAHRLYGWRAAVLLTLVAGLVPRFFLVSGQFRTDDMWAALWLVGLAFVVGCPPRWWRYFVAGLMFGAALSVSQKTVVLLLTSGVAALAIRWLGPDQADRGGWRCWLAGLGGLLVVPVIFLAWFAVHGALGDVWYGLVSYNTGGQGRRHVAQQTLWFVMLSAVLVVVTLWGIRRRALSAFDWPMFMLLQGGLFVLLIWFVWPLITRQDFLPVLPTLVLAGGGWLSQRAWLSRRPRLRLAAVLLVLGAELVTIICYAPPWRDALARQRDELAVVLRYTDKSDTVMDAKGDAIFRQRPYYPVLESLAMHRLRVGSMTDTILQDMAEHHTMIVMLRRFPHATARFVMLNFLPAGGSVGVAGLMLPTHDADQGIDVAVPGDYVLTDGNRRLRASVDGAPVADHWELAAGTHHFKVEAGLPLALVWTQAFDRGWRPVPRELVEWR